jgi:hypothetical protein
MKTTLLMCAAATAALCLATNASFAASLSGKQYPYQINGKLALAHGGYGPLIPATHSAAARGQCLCEPPGQVGDRAGQWDGYRGWRWDGDPRWHWDGYPRWLWHG